MKKIQRDELREKQRLQKEGVALGETEDTDQEGVHNDDVDGMEDENLFGSDDPAMNMDID